jgi:hypothetical protein
MALYGIACIYINVTIIADTQRSSGSDIKARRVAGTGKCAGIIAMVDQLTVFAIVSGAFVALWAHASARVECKVLTRRIATSAILGETRIVWYTRTIRPLPLLMVFLLAATSHFAAIQRAAKPSIERSASTIVACAVGNFEAFLVDQLHPLRTGTAHDQMVELI